MLLRNLLKLDAAMPVAVTPDDFSQGAEGFAAIGKIKMQRDIFSQRQRQR